MDLDSSNGPLRHTFYLKTFLHSIIIALWYTPWFEMSGAIKLVQPIGLTSGTIIMTNLKINIQGP